MVYYVCEKCNGKGKDDYYNSGIYYAVNGNSRYWCECSQGGENDCIKKKHGNKIVECRKETEYVDYYNCKKCNGTGKITWLQRVFE